MLQMVLPSVSAVNDMAEKLLGFCGTEIASRQNDIPSLLVKAKDIMFSFILSGGSIPDEFLRHDFRSLLTLVQLCLHILNEHLIQHQPCSGHQY